MITAAALALAFSLQGPSADYAKTWTAVRSAIEGRYWARQTQKSRMESLLAKYEPRAKAASTEAEFSRAVNDMIEDFGDSHFALLTRSDQGFYMMDSLRRGKDGTPMPHIGAWFKPDGDGYTIQMLLEGGQAAQAGMRKGDRIRTIDGRPFSPVDALKDRVDQKARLGYVRGGASKEAEVAVKKSNGIDFFLDATKSSMRTIESGGKKIGYLHLWTMSNEDQKNALSGAVYGRFKDTDAFILDIRDGFGGRPEGYGDPFFRPEVNLTWDFGGFQNQQLFGYQRPLVVLINRGSRSAKEVFAYIMKSSKRATLIGETTAGHVLGTTPSPLDDWAYLEIPMVDVKTDGIRLEKAGVSPDIALPREFDDQGRDLYIEEAVKVLSARIGKKAA